MVTARCLILLFFLPFFLFLCFLCLFLIYSFERYIASCGWCKCFRPNTVGKHMTLSPTCWVRLKSVLDAAGSQNNNIIMYSNAPSKLDPADLLLDVVAQLTLVLEMFFFLFSRMDPLSLSSVLAAACVHWTFVPSYHSFVHASLFSCLADLFLPPFLHLFAQNSLLILRSFPVSNQSFFRSKFLSCFTVYRPGRGFFANNRNHYGVI